MTTQKLSMPSVRRALTTLWEKNSSQLSTDELKWFAGFVEQAHLNAEDLADTVAGIGFLVGNDEHAGSFQANHSVMTLMTSLSQQIDAIAGMIYVGDCAIDRLMNPERYQRPAGDHDETLPTGDLTSEAAKTNRA